MNHLERVVKESATPAKSPFEVWEERRDDCAWCGGEIFDAFPNRRGERFCSKYHRDASGRALRRFLQWALTV